MGVSNRYKKEDTSEALGPYSFIQRISGHRVTEDPLLLVDFLGVLGETDSVIDIGTGTGVIPLLLAWKTRATRITGVEVQQGLLEEARENVALNGLEDRVRLIESDFRDLPALFAEGSFSLVVSNPPHVKAGAGRSCPDASRAVARSEVMGTLADLLQVSSHLAGSDGRVAYIYPVNRLDEMLSGLVAVGFKPRRLRFVQTTAGDDAKLFLIEAGRTGTLKMEGSPPG